MTPKTIESILDEIEERANQATRECLCGLPGCKKCEADDLFERHPRTDVPRLTKSLRLAIDHFKLIEIHSDDKSMAIGANRAQEEIKQILEGNRQTKTDLSVGTDKTTNRKIP